VARQRERRSIFSRPLEERQWQSHGFSQLVMERMATTVETRTALKESADGALAATGNELGAEDRASRLAVCIALQGARHVNEDTRSGGQQQEDRHLRCRLGDVLNQTYLMDLIESPLVVEFTGS
jgi:hypothetical protein